MPLASPICPGPWLHIAGALYIFTIVAKTKMEEVERFSEQGLQ